MADDNLGIVVEKYFREHGTLSTVGVGIGRVEDYIGKRLTLGSEESRDDPCLIHRCTSIPLDKDLPAFYAGMRVFYVHGEQPVPACKSHTAEFDNNTVESKDTRFGKIVADALGGGLVFYPTYAAIVAVLESRAFLDTFTDTHTLYVTLFAMTGSALYDVGKAVYRSMKARPQRQ